MATELRVHGVSGTPAESMLDRPLLRRVAGDGNAGFYRPRPEYGATTGPGGADLEAYRWGNLTAGAAARAFWLLLLPFTLANVMMWLRPTANRFGRAITRGLVRIFALSVTATFTLAAVEVALDLIAWQCATPGSRCTVDRPWIQFFFTGFFAPTGRRLALAAMLPILAVCGLWLLARRTWARYESFKLPEVRLDGDGLAAPTFWYGRVQVGRLRSLHIASAFAIIDAVLLYVLIRRDRSVAAYVGVDLVETTPAVVRAVGMVLAGIVAVILLACMLLLLVRGMVDRDAPAAWAGTTAAGLRWLALLATLGTLGYALVPRGPWVATGSLPGYAATVTWLFAGQAGLLGLLLLVIAVQRLGPDVRRLAKWDRPLLAGFTAPIVGSLSLGLGAAFSAGLAYRVADYLDRAAVPSPAEFAAQPVVGRLEPPLSFQWAAFGFLVAVVVFILTAVWVRVVTLPRLRRKAVPDTDEDFPGGRARDPHRARAIDAAIANARLADHLGRIVGVVWVVLAAAGLATTVLALRGRGPIELAGPSGSTAARVMSILTNAGTYLISLSALGLILLGIQAYRNERVRRVVGVVWDLATFWPRGAHPLGAPCYAERVVPELVHRTTWLATERGGVVLSGHSQGTVLAAATVLQLPVQARAGTSLLTYGSPLRRLYARAFPAYINDDVLADVGAGLSGGPLTDSPRPLDGQPRWINLWRRTDPIGGHIDTRGIGDRAVGRASVPTGVASTGTATSDAGAPTSDAGAPVGPPSPDAPATTPADAAPASPAAETAVVRSKPVPPTRAPHCADVRFIDPNGFDPVPGDRVPPEIRGHSDYQLSPGFGDAVAALITRLPD